jgi:ATP phosphoribosyltransferase regulatory subunit
MLEMLALSGAQNVHLDLGHVGIYRALAEQANLDAQQESELFDVLQRKARTELAELLTELAISEDLKADFNALPKLNGDQNILATAAATLKTSSAAIDAAIADLQTIAAQFAKDYPSLTVSFDLAELRGYHYHTGMVFAAFVPTIGKEIARGGRYDNIGAVFGRARPATGFSADLKVLAALLDDANQAEKQCIFAPALPDDDLSQTIRDLRASGTLVIRQLPGQSGSAEDMGCNAVLEKQAHKWVVKPLTHV